MDETKPETPCQAKKFKKRKKQRKKVIENTRSASAPISKKELWSCDHLFLRLTRSEREYQKSTA